MYCCISRTWSPVTIITELKILKYNRKQKSKFFDKSKTLQKSKNITTKHTREKHPLVTTITQKKNKSKNTRAPIFS